MKAFSNMFRLLVLSILGITSTIRSQPSLYEVVEIDMASYRAYRINDSSQVLMNGSWSSNPGIWDDGNYIQLPDLPDLYHRADIRDINNSSIVVGYAFEDGANEAVKWVSNQILKLFPIRPPNIRSTEAHVINDNGVIGGIEQDTSYIYRPFIYSNGIMNYLPSLSRWKCYISEINESNIMVGMAMNSEQWSQAVMWMDNSIIELGLPATQSSAIDINNENLVIGQIRSASDAPDQRKTFLWENGNITYLPNLGYGSQGGGINDEGVIVYTFLDSDLSLFRGVRYFNNRAEYLDDLIPDNSNLIVKVAIDINNKGEILCQVVKDGNIVYCILKPIEILITSPKPNEKWIAGEEDTIRWEGGQENEVIKLLYSTDEGNNFELIDAGIPANDTMYVWDIPDTLLSRKSIIRIEKNDNSDVLAESELFRIKPYILTKVDQNGEYIKYEFSKDSWGFANEDQDVWPSSYWYGRFDYNNGIDPFTNDPYSQWQGDSVFYNAFQYEFPDWISFVNTFGVDACYINISPNIYSSTALQIWKAQKGEWEGSCFGIAISNALGFEVKDEFLHKYTNFPNFTNPKSVNSDTSVIPVITELHTHQFGNPHFAHLYGNALNTSPSTTIKNIKEMLKSDTVKIQTLSFRSNSTDPNNQGGHAILAYKLEQDDTNPNIYRVYVYDNSYPNESEARIIVDVEHIGSNGIGLWDPEYGWNGWGGDKWFYLRLPVEKFLTNPTISKIGQIKSPFILAENLLRIQSLNNSDLLMTNNIGQSIGIRNDILVNTIPDAFPNIIENGSVGRPSGYILPSDNYSISLNNLKDSNSKIETHIYSGNKTFVYNRSDVIQTQSDKLFYDGGVSVINSDMQTKTINMMNIINETSQEKVFMIRSLGLEKTDSVKFINPDDDKLDLISFGNSKNYDLEINFPSELGIMRFSHKHILLGSNTTHRLVPNWGDFASMGLQIFVDKGNDGTIDDTLHLEDQSTGVEEHGSNELPTEFNIDQNYPNPFNATTMISYSISEVSHVRLKVFNIIGEEVAELVNDVKEIGNHNVSFNASELTSGIYFYKLQANDFVETKKMILMK